MAINWTQVNIPTIVTILGVAWGVVQYVNNFDKRLTETEQYRVMRASQTDKNFLDVAKSIESLRADNVATRTTIQDLPYRVGSVEKGLAEQVAQTNRLTELIINNMDGFRKEMNSLGTKIEVLTSRIDNNFPARKTQLLISPIPRVH